MNQINGHPAPGGAGIEPTTEVLVTAAAALLDALASAERCRVLAREVAVHVAPGETGFTDYVEASLAATRARLDAVIAAAGDGQVAFEAACRSLDALAARSVRDPRADLAILHNRTAPYRRFAAPMGQPEMAVTPALPIRAIRGAAPYPSATPPALPSRTTEADRGGSLRVDAAPRRGLGGLLDAWRRPVDAAAPVAAAAAPVAAVGSGDVAPIAAAPATPEFEPVATAEPAATDPATAGFEALLAEAAQDWPDEPGPVEAEAAQVPDAGETQPGSLDGPDGPSADGRTDAPDLPGTDPDPGAATSGSMRAAARPFRSGRRAALLLGALALLVAATPVESTASMPSQRLDRPGFDALHRTAMAPEASPALPAASLPAPSADDLAVVPDAPTVHEDVTMPPTVADVAIAPIVFGRVETKRKVIALTFDDGYSVASLRSIFAVLEDEGVMATFFVNGVYLSRDPGLWAEIAAAGYPIANHTWGHADVTTLSAHQITLDLQRNRNAVEAVTGVPMAPWFRPPYGAHDAASDAAVAAAGFPVVVLWDTTAGDTAKASNARASIANATKGTAGSIVLMHVGPRVTPTIIAAVIRSYRARGFEFVTVGDLLTANQ